MNKKYIAVFKALAEVEIKVEVSAENLTEGLVAAHDKVLTAPLSDAVVTKLFVDEAKNIGMETAEQTLPETAPVSELTTAPASLAVVNEHSVYLYADKDQTQFLEKVTFSTFQEAETLAFKVREQLLLAASAVVRDSLGNFVLSTTSRRGGWELVASSAQKDCTESHTWLTDLSEVRLLMKQYALSHEKIQVYDLTNREKGAVLYLEIY